MPSAVAVVAFDIETRQTTNLDVISRIKQSVLSEKCPIKKPISANPKEVTLTKYESDCKEWELSTGQRIAEEMKKTSVNPLLAEVICLSLTYLEDGVEKVIGIDDFDGDCIESSVLIEFASAWGTLADEKTVITGQNIRGFDLSVIYNSCVRNKVRLPDNFPKWYGNRWHGRIFDTMTDLPTRDKFCSFSEISNAYGLPDPKSIEWNGGKMSGSRVQAAYEAKAFELLRKYNQEDALCSLRLYEQICLASPPYEDTDSLRTTIQAILEMDILSASEKVATISNILK